MGPKKRIRMRNEESISRDYQVVTNFPVFALVYSSISQYRSIMQP